MTMAKNTSLFLRIGEAKNLPAKDIRGTSDPYCVIKVDNEHVARTATVWKTLNPFWGEEFTLHLPNGFHQLSIYIYDEDLIGADDVIGKVTIRKNQLSGIPKGIATWMHIDKIKKDEEVQGEIHVQIGRYSRKGQQQIRVKVIAARDLAAKDTMGASDPYVVLKFSDQKRITHKVRRSRYPRWNESHEFDVPLNAEPSTLLSIIVWDWDRVGSDDFMGMVQFTLADLPPNQTFNRWLKLLPKDSTLETSDSEVNEGLGRIQVNARLMEERILPSQYYAPLIQVLLDSLSQTTRRPKATTPLKMLQEVMTLDLLEMANILVKLFLGQGKIVEYLDLICTEEINDTNNPNTLFRGNTLATKSLDQFMKIVGMSYLHGTLGSLVDRIYEEHKTIELDPGRLDAIRGRRRSSILTGLSDRQIIEQSCTALLTYVSAAKTHILNSVPRMPPVMRIVFRMLCQRIEQRWPGRKYEDQKYVCVSCFLFLRFITPAIMSPKLFLLRQDHSDMRTTRTLTLVAKTVQNMGNLGQQIGLGKEQWMQPVHGFILNSVPDMKRFIDSIVSIDDPSAYAHSNRRRSVFEPSAVIKEGYLWKKRWFNSTFLRLFTFKKRYFWLKFDYLAYAKKANDRVMTTMSTSSLQVVERVEKQAFCKENVGQMIIKNSEGKLDVLYFQAKDINEMYSWLSAIRKVIITNTGLLDMYHPGLYRCRRWTCCSQLDQKAPGCSKTHSQPTLGDWRDPLDPDVEAQMIYSQLVNGKHILRQKYVESTQMMNNAASGGSGAVSPSTPTASDPGTPSASSTGSPTMLITNNRSSLQKSLQDERIASVAQLLDVVKDLERAHNIFSLMEQESEQVSTSQPMQRKLIAEE